MKDKDLNLRTHKQENLKHFHKSNPIEPAPKDKPSRPTPPRSDGRGKRVSDCGDEIELYVDLREGVVSDVTCRVHGCDNTVITARAAGVLAKGRPLQEAMKLARADIIVEMTHLETQHHHCAELAAEAMRNALKDAVANAREPWRSLYRKP
jgi:nitrogen fixation NifU-like protein